MCEVYQKNFTLEATEINLIAALVDHEFDDGIKYCIDQCSTTHGDSCVGVQMARDKTQ